MDNIALINYSSEVKLERSMMGGLGFQYDLNEETKEYPFLLPPSNLILLGTILKCKNFKVELFDFNFDNQKSDFENRMEEFNIIITTLHYPSFWYDYKFINQFDSLEQIIVLTNIAEYILDPNINRRTKRYYFNDNVKIIIGDWHEIIEDVVSQNISKKILKQKTPSDMSLFPVMDLSILKEELYHYYNADVDIHIQNSVKTFSFQTSMGCPYPCSYYCAYPLTEGKTQRVLPKDTVFNTIDKIEESGFKHILFRDAVFTLNKKRAKSICKYLMVKNLAWTCETRPECLDDELIFLMRISGCKNIIFGLESGNKIIRKTIGKTGSLELLKQVVNKCKENNINSHFTVIIGWPNETREMIDDTVIEILNIEPNTLSIFKATPYPGTQFFEDVNIKNLKPNLLNQRVGLNDITDTSLSIPKKLTLEDSELNLIISNIYEKFGNNKWKKF